MTYPNFIILIGLPSSGKSEIGLLLAQKLGYDFTDSDSLIIDHCKDKSKNVQTIQQCFSILGEKEFRNLEKKKIKELFQTKEQKFSVISTGGGAIIDSDNRKIFKSMGTIVFIDTPLLVIKSRIQSQSERPLFGTNILERLNQLNSERRPIMLEIADITVDGEDSADEVCTKIISQL